jgi:hypothetical protein
MIFKEFGSFFFSMGNDFCNPFALIIELIIGLSVSIRKET